MLFVYSVAHSDFPMQDPAPMKHSFRQRIAEFHHGLNLDPDGQASQSRMKDILHRASALGMNTVYFGESWPQGLHRMVSYRAKPELAALVDQAAVARRQGAYLELAELASNLKLDLHAVIHPISYPSGFLERYPEAAAVAHPGWDRHHVLDKPMRPALCPHQRSTREMLQCQVEEILELPGIQGVSCWMNMADSLVFACDCPICRSQTLDVCISEIGNFLHDICAAKKKALNIRTYLGSWQCGLETACFKSVDAQLQPAVRLTYKQQQGDMYNEHPINPLLGALGERPQSMEIDCYGEYRGSAMGLITSCRHQIQERLKKASQVGLDSAVMRGIHHEHTFAVDHACFSALTRDVNCDVDAVALSHLSKRFGEAAPGILAILDDGNELCHRTMYVSGVHWASWSVPAGLNRLRFILFDRSASCVPGALQGLQVDEALLIKHEALQAEAISLAEGMKRRAEALSPFLSREDEAALLASVQMADAYARLCHCLMASVLQAFRWEACPSPTMREFLRLDLLDYLRRATGGIEDSFQRIQRVDGSALSPLMGPIELLNLTPAQRLVEPVKNARIICDEIASLIDKPPTSFTGISPLPYRWPAGISPRDYGLL